LSDLGKKRFTNARARVESVARREKEIRVEPETIPKIVDLRAISIQHIVVCA
jgi:hypothetical protein